jgi:hypothetical protein
MQILNTIDTHKLCLNLQVTDDYLAASLDFNHLGLNAITIRIRDDLATAAQCLLEKLNELLDYTN